MIYTNIILTRFSVLVPITARDVVCVKIKEAKI